MTDRERDRLIEAALTAWRPRAPDGSVLPHPAWADLAEAERLQVFDETVRARSIERLLDPEGLSTTARAVLGRISLAQEP